VLTVAVLGMPNSGKSTLVNHFVGTRVSAVTHVAHTTRRAANGVVNVDDTQIVFTDTPGVISYEEGRRLNMDKMQVRAPGRVCASVDLLAVMVDVSRRSTREHVDGNILNILNEYSSLPSVLIMNKVDLVRQKVNLLNYASMLTIDREKDEWGYKSFGGWSKFEEVFMVSAHTGDGLSDLLDFFLRRAYASDWLYSANIHTDTSIEEQIAEVFREKLLLLFKHEIPWKMKQETQLIDIQEDGTVRIHQKLTWPKKSQRRYVLTKIDELTSQAMEELSNLFECPIKLTVDISYKKGARKDLLHFY